MREREGGRERERESQREGERERERAEGATSGGRNAQLCEATCPRVVGLTISYLDLRKWFNFSLEEVFSSTGCH